MMTSRRFSTCSRFAIALLVSAVSCPALFAQGPSVEAPKAFVQPIAPISRPPLSVDGNHKFWDRGNIALFTAVAAVNTADFAITRSNLRAGGEELNPVVRLFGKSTPGLAVNFAGETVGIIGVSYFLHKTGHHKMERAISFVNIGSSASAVGFGLMHR
jgi:hypothetical protein